MPRSAPSPASRRSQAGFSLLELLVAVGMLGIGLSAAVAFASTQLRLVRQNHLRVEVRHALRASADSIVRDLRLAAACMPQTGAFVSLDGIDDGMADTLTIRTGFAQDNLACVATTNNALHGMGSSAFTVDTTDGFEEASLGYLRHLDGDGEFFSIANVDSVTNTITRGEPASRDYPVGSGVFAVDERTYALDTGSNPPRLTLEIGQNGPVPFAIGITEFQVKYILDRNCPPCDVVDMPVDDVEWWRVNQVSVTLTGETVNPRRWEDEYSETRTVIGKPRNLLP